MSEQVMDNRELDALVAEQVMGWHEENGRWLNNKDSYRLNTIAWIPSMSMEDAWQVVEALEARGWLVDMERMARPDGSVLTVCRFHDHQVLHSETDEVPATAICKAALRVVAWERKKEAGQ